MNKDALTAPEVAEILKIAQNTVYELVKRGELNCYKVGRKMRFTYEDVQRYINESRGVKVQTVQRQEEVPSSGVRKEEGSSRERQKDVFRICGQDEILDVLTKYMMLQMPGLQVECVHKGSYDSLVNLYKDQVLAAASHMWDPETDSYNRSFVKSFLPGCDTVIIHVAKRQQGFYVAEGNPKGLHSWEDLKKPGIILANREPGAGTRILLDEHLQRLGIQGGEIEGYHRALFSHVAVAGSVAKGEADLGIGTEKAALSMRGLEFVPLQMEQYDLIVKKENMNRPEIQLMLQILRSDDFREQFRFMSGYDVEQMGEIVEERI